MSSISGGMHNAWVLVGDGRRALFFVNQGDAELLDLRVTERRRASIKIQQPAIAEALDAPGREFCLQRRRADARGQYRLA